MKNQRWITLQPDAERVELLRTQLPMLPTPLLQILVHRGVDTFDKARYFFSPSLSSLHDPFLMKGMTAAVDRILLAMERGERILIYGDYDVDGTTSVALVYTCLKQRYSNLDYYVPNRYTEGYGISFQGVDYAEEHQCGLIIALDCGIKEGAKVDYARERGIDFIICDHHLPGSDIPQALAVLDPKQTDCSYPYKELSGCGIGFKLMQALAVKRGESIESLKPLMDLLVVSIAADIVPITGENRILAHFGLEQLNSFPCPGLRELLGASGVKRKLSISDVVFTLGPRINAAGRMEDARFAVKLLIGEEHSAENKVNADKLQDMNKSRQQFDRNITDSALAMIRESAELQSKWSTVLYQSDWHKGVIGIVASRLIEHYYRPTIVLTESEGKLAGSARSIKNFDMYEAIYACKDHVIQFGGHYFAAGLTMKPEQLPGFIQRFEEVARERLKPEDLIPTLEVDAEVDFPQLTTKFYNLMQRLSPFGPGNMKPVFVSRGVRDTGFARLLKEEHLKLTLQQERNGPRFEAIGFGMADCIDLVRQGPVDIAYTLEENNYNGQISLQFHLKDLRAAETP